MAAVLPATPCPSAAATVPAGHSATTAMTDAVAATLAVLLAWPCCDDPVFHHPGHLACRPRCLLRPLPLPTRQLSKRTKRHQQQRRQPMVFPAASAGWRHGAGAASLNWMHDASADMFVTDAAMVVRLEGWQVLSCILLPFSPLIIGSDDTAVVEHVLKTRLDVYDKDIVGRGIFAVDGDEWRTQRKSAVLIFNVRLGSILRYSPARCAAWRRGSGGSETLDLNYAGQLLPDWVRAAAGETPIAFATAFDAVQVQVMSRFYTPSWWLFELVSPAAHAFRLHLATIESLSRAIIHERIAKFESAADAGDSNDGPGGDNKSGGEADLLSFLTRSPDPILGQPPSPDQLVDCVINFIFAGRDTTAQAFSRAFWCCTATRWLAMRCWRS
ncbi:hypothetical protein HK405_010993 [Cladochytrium tenue]|nr:hypothetical protein HK405_010993 [Cladochytrium tenue]